MRTREQVKPFMRRVVEREHYTEETDRLRLECGHVRFGRTTFDRTRARHVQCVQCKEGQLASVGDLLAEPLAHAKADPVRSVRARVTRGRGRVGTRAQREAD